MKNTKTLLKSIEYEGEDWLPFLMQIMRSDYQDITEWTTARPSRTMKIQRDLAACHSLYKHKNKYKYKHKYKYRYKHKYKYRYLGKMEVR